MPGDARGTEIIEFGKSQKDEKEKWTDIDWLLDNMNGP